MKTAFQRLFGKSQSKNQHNQKRRLGAESLEDRRLMTVTPHGGAIMPHVELQGVYFGQDWRNNSTLFQQTGQLEGFLGTLARGNYLDMLTNAGYGVGRGTQDAGRTQAVVDRGRGGCDRSCAGRRNCRRQAQAQASD